MLEVTPGDPRALIGMGSLHARRLELEQAEAFYLEAYRKAPDYARPVVRIFFVTKASHLEKRDDDDGAIEALRMAIHYAPTHPDAHAWLGLVLTRLDRADEARVPLTEALRLSADEQRDTARFCEQIGFSNEVSARWMCLAGHTGDGYTRLFLGIHYRDSSPTTQDLIQAYKWFSLAVIAGDKTAQISRDLLSPQLTPGQIAEAERLVAEWEPNPAECETIGAQVEN